VCSSDLISWLDNNKEATTERYEELLKEFSEKLGLGSSE
jgi:hypothetical protein